MLENRKDDSSASSMIVLTWQECAQNKTKCMALIKGDEEKEEMRLGSLWLLSSTQEKDKKTKVMMYVDVKVKGLVAFVDTGASNIFMANQVAKKPGMQVKKGKKTGLKTINLKEVPTTRITKDLNIPIR